MSKVYGQNQFCGPSSLTPGQTVTSGLDITPPGGDPSRELVKSRGMKTADFLPEMAKGGRPRTFGMTDPNRNNPTIPGGVDWHNAPGPAPRPKGE